MIRNITVGENGFLYLHGTLSKWCYHEDGFREVEGPFRMHRSAVQVRDLRGEIITNPRGCAFSVTLYCKSSYKGDYRLGELFVERVSTTSSITFTILSHWREWLKIENQRLEELYRKQKAAAEKADASIESVPFKDADKLKLVA